MADPIDCELHSYWPASSARAGSASRMSNPVIDRTGAGWRSRWTRAKWYVYDLKNAGTELARRHAGIAHIALGP